MMNDLLRQLVAMRTVSLDKKANHAALDFIERYLEERGMFTRRFECNGFGSLIATVRPTKTPTAFLAAHLDVVPGPDHLFAMREENGKLYGRGVYDMKFAIAAYMHLVDELRDKLFEYDFGLMITTDEEISGIDGTGYLLREGFVPQFAILPDGGDNWQFEETRRGYYGSRIRVSGKAAHGSRPWEGDSATIRLHEILTEIRALFPHPMTPKGDTLNISGLAGGEAINQIPATAEALLDMRSADPERFVSIDSSVRKICQKHGAQYDILTQAAVGITDLENPYVKIFRDIIGERIGVTTTSHSFGATDARLFDPMGVTTLSVQPYGGGRHSEDEWLDAKAVEQFYGVLREFVDTALHVSTASKSVDTAQKLV